MTRREVEPYRILQLGGHWYLTAFDPERNDWRNFRLDRLEIKGPARARFAPRPEPDPTAVFESMDAMFRRHRAVVAAPAGEVTSQVPVHVSVEPIDAERCRVFATGATAYDVAISFLLFDHDFALEEASPAIRMALQMILKHVTEA